MTDKSELISKESIEQIRGLFKISDESVAELTLQDSAADYFGNMFLDSLSVTVSYRDQHPKLIGPLTIKDMSERVQLYEQAYEKTLFARQFLEERYPELVEIWADSKGSSLIVFNEVVAEIIVKDNDYQQEFMDKDDIDNWLSDCRGTAQWLYGWLKSERSN